MLRPQCRLTHCSSSAHRNGLCRIHWRAESRPVLPVASVHATGERSRSGSAARPGATQPKGEK